MSDPFTQVYDGLWAAAESHEGLARAVREGNRIKFCREAGDYDPRQLASNPGATPQLMLLPDYFDSNLVESNFEGVIIRVFSWTIRTSSRLLNKDLFPVEWALLDAMLKAKKDKDTRLSKLLPDVVRDLNVTRGSQLLPPIDSTYEDNSFWYSAWTVEVHIKVPHG